MNEEIRNSGIQAKIQVVIACYTKLMHIHPSKATYSYHAKPLAVRFSIYQIIPMLANHCRDSKAHPDNFLVQIPQLYMVREVVVILIQ